MAARRPAFVIIGAAKAATTWLGNRLRDRPDVFLPLEEPHFFSREFARGPEWYGDLFADAAPGQLLGEKSADYLHDRMVPARLHAMLPEARLVVQLRDPVERAYSDYCMFFRRGTVDGDIVRHLDPARDRPVPRFVADGFYHEQLSRFLAFYPADRVKVILFEDIKADAAGVAREVEDFLGLPPLAAVPAAGSRANVKDAPMLPLPLRRALAPAKQLVAPLRSHGWFKALHRRLAREIAYPPLPASLAASLRAHYADDISRLELMLGRDLTSWKQTPPRLKARDIRAA